MASQKRPSQRHGSKYLASASTMDHARHGFLPRHRDTGILDSLGRFFGADRGAPKRGSGKVPWLKQSRSPLPPHARSRPGLCNMYQDGHHAARTTHYGSLPQKAQHGRPQDENPVVHFFKNIVTPRTPPPSQGKGRGLSLSSDHTRSPRPLPPRSLGDGSFQGEAGEGGWISMIQRFLLTEAKLPCRKGNICRWMGLEPGWLRAGQVLASWLHDSRAQAPGRDLRRHGRDPEGLRWLHVCLRLTFRANPLLPLLGHN
uniref:Myelin basic protein n=1 Tax=Sus scrofa TaxID=9823 RepID=A0A8D1L9A8_PIG